MEGGSVYLVDWGMGQEEDDNYCHPLWRVWVCVMEEKTLYIRTTYLGDKSIFIVTFETPWIKHWDKMEEISLLYHQLLSPPSIIRWIFKVTPISFFKSPSHLFRTWKALHLLGIWTFHCPRLFSSFFPPCVLPEGWINNTVRSSASFSQPTCPRYVDKMDDVGTATFLGNILGNPYIC